MSNIEHHLKKHRHRWRIDITIEQKNIAIAGEIDCKDYYSYYVYLIMIIINISNVIIIF